MHLSNYYQCVKYFICQSKFYSTFACSFLPRQFFKNKSTNFFPNFHQDLFTLRRARRRTKGNTSVWRRTQSERNIHILLNSTSEVFTFFIFLFFTLAQFLHFFIINLWPFKKPTTYSGVFSFKSFLVGLLF